jgi:hypothetical protein
MFIKIENSAAVLLGAVLLFAAMAFLYPAQVQATIDGATTMLANLLQSVAGALGA